MRTPSPNALLVALLALAGCDGGARDDNIVIDPPWRLDLPPPEGSGVVAADLSGVWTLVAIEDHEGRPPANDEAERFPDWPGLVPPRLGDQFSLTSGEWLQGDGEALRREDWDPGQQERIGYYTNRVDERFAIYTASLRDTAGTPERSEEVLQMAFGTITANEMIGVLYYSERNIHWPPEQSHPPIGWFRLIARRVP